MTDLGRLGIVVMSVVGTACNIWGSGSVVASQPTPTASTGTGSQSSGNTSGNSGSGTGGSTGDLGGAAPSPPVSTESLASGTYFSIVLQSAGQALDVAGASSSDGAAMQLNTASGARSQQWMLLSMGDNNYQFVNINSGKCATAASGGGTLTQSTCDGNDLSQTLAVAVNGPQTAFTLGLADPNRCLGAQGGTLTAVACSDDNAFWTIAARELVAAEPFAWTGILGTGQSLSIGVYGNPIIDGLVSSGYNLKLFDSNGTYDLARPTSPSLAVQPLVEPMRPIIFTQPNQAYPNNIAGETPHTSMGGQLSALMQAAGVTNYVTAHTAVGRGGQPLSVIDKDGTGNAYAASLFEARAFANLAQSANKTFGYGAIVLTHGEADAANPNYGNSLQQFYNDYISDLQSITGQTSPIVMLASQQNSKPDNNYQFPYSSVTLLEAAASNPNRIFVTGPKYQYGGYVGGVHLGAAGYRALGEKYAEVYFRIVHNHEAWRPLQPSTVKFTTPTQLTVTFDIPNPPLAFDVNMPAVHQTANTAWAQGRGFEVFDSTHQPVSITNVALDSTFQRVIITLASQPTLPIKLQYAITQDGALGSFEGSPLGRAGQVRDSDPFIGLDQEIILCTAMPHSNVLDCPPGSLARRQANDIVVEATAILLSTNSHGQATLNKPWSGGPGTFPLTFHSNQHNYLVAFSLQVP